MRTGNENRLSGPDGLQGEGYQDWRHHVELATDETKIISFICHEDNPSIKACTCLIPTGGNLRSQLIVFENLIGKGNAGFSKLLHEGGAETG